MLKAALLCSVLCTAFVVGGHLPTPNKPAQVAKAVSLQKALKPFVGKNCYVSNTKDGTWFISFTKHFAKTRNFKLDMLGSDFVRISNKKGKTYILFSSIRQINID